MVDLDMSTLRRIHPRNDKKGPMSWDELHARYEALTEEQKEKVKQSIEEKERQQPSTSTTDAPKPAADEKR